MRRLSFSMQFKRTRFPHSGRRDYVQATEPSAKRRGRLRQTALNQRRQALDQHDREHHSDQRT
ncbi:hypothetical protein P3T22_003337 [Paraburkholderia sp. GAS348]